MVDKTSEAPHSKNINFLNEQTYSYIPLAPKKNPLQ